MMDKGISCLDSEPSLFIMLFEVASSIITGRLCTDQFSEIAAPPADVIFIKDYWKRKKEKTT